MYGSEVPYIYTYVNHTFLKLGLPGVVDVAVKQPLSSVIWLVSRKAIPNAGVTRIIEGEVAGVNFDTYVFEQFVE